MTDLQTLSDDQARAVRDDRSDITDGVYRLLELPIDGIALRTTVFAYLSGLHTEAIADSLRRLATPTTDQETAR